MDKAFGSLVDKALGIKSCVRASPPVRCRKVGEVQESSAPIQIFIRNLANKTIGISTSTDATIGDIKEEIQRQGMCLWHWQVENSAEQNSSEGIPVDEQRLISKGIQLLQLQLRFGADSVTTQHWERAHFCFGLAASWRRHSTREPF